MLIEWLEPIIKMHINEMNNDIEDSCREMYGRLSQIIHEAMDLYPQRSKQAMEVEEIFNKMLLTSIDLTYRRGFNDCYKLLQKLP